MLAVHSSHLQLHSISSVMLHWLDNDYKYLRLEHMTLCVYDGLLLMGCGVHAFASPGRCMVVDNGQGL